MNTILHLILAFPAGFALGILYFGSLWLTVRQLPTTRYPIRLFVGSYLGRMAIALLGFYVIINGHWERALVGVLGLIVARTLLVRHFEPKPWHLEQQVSHGNQ